MYIYQRGFVQLQLGAATALSIVLVVVDRPGHRRPVPAAAREGLTMATPDDDETPWRPDGPHAGRASATGRSESRAKRHRSTGWAGSSAALVFLVPLLWSVLRSFQSNDAIVSATPSFSALTRFTTENFRTPVHRGRRHLSAPSANSLVVAISTAVLTAVVATLAGYGFGRFRFRGAQRPVRGDRGDDDGALPGDHHPALPADERDGPHRLAARAGAVLPTVNLPFGVFVMRNAFETIPAEIEDSARVDGAGTLRVLVSVLRPMLVPGVATVRCTRSWPLDGVPRGADVPHRRPSLHAAAVAW